MIPFKSQQIVKGFFLTQRFAHHPGYYRKPIAKKIKTKIMKGIIRMTTAFFLASLFVVSCKKDDVKPVPAPTAKDLLTAKTWQMEEVTDNHGTPQVVYKKGAANNEEDYSLVRQAFKADGTITYIDQFGDAGTNGTYELLENNTRIRLGMTGSSLSVVAQSLNVSASRFSYHLVDGAGYVQFTFSPVQ